MYQEEDDILRRTCECCGSVEKSESSLIHWTDDCDVEYQYCEECRIHIDKEN